MVNKLDDVWTSRDFPVLREVARLLDQEGNTVRVADLERATGLSGEDLQRSVRALEARGLLHTLGVGSGKILRVGRLSGEAYVLTGLHPRGEDAIDRLIDALMQAAEQASEPEQRTKLKRAAEALGEVTKSVTSGVMTAIVSGAIGT